MGKRLLERVTNGDVVITTKLDRMFRSTVDAPATLDEFKDQGVGLHMIDLGGDCLRQRHFKNMFTIKMNRNATAAGRRPEEVPSTQAESEYLAVASVAPITGIADRPRLRPSA